MNKNTIFDGHNDTLTELFVRDHNKTRSFLRESTEGHIDLPRAKRGGLRGGFFAICVPPPKSSPEQDPMYGLTLTDDGYEIKYRSRIDFSYSHDFTNSVIDFAFQLERESEGKIKIVSTYNDLIECLNKDIFAVALHLEGAEAIGGDISNIEYYRHKGIRSIGIVWSRPNIFGFGVPYKHPHSPDTGLGLTDLGKNLVTVCNDLGVIVDLSHLNEKGFWEVVEISKDPLVISHGGVYSLCPSTRNYTDRQIDSVGKSGGVIGVWFEPVHIKYQIGNDKMPIEDVPLIEIVRHIDYIANRIGIDHVALGSDFDGANTPVAIKDVSYLPNLINELNECGYSDEKIEKIAYKNWMRVIGDTW